jgi:murein DD-endopeptidase MepM/ murein hydrolase activator NlpD
MATTTFKPTINIKSSFTTIGAGFTRANKSLGSMKTVLLKRTKIKRDAIAGRKSLFGKRIENQRRKDEEAVVEASKPSAIGRIGNSVLNSGKGLFGRIMDFVGTLLIGWLVNNLPTIITMAQDLIGRIQKTVTILGNFMKGIGGIFTGSTKVFGAVLTNITSFDFFDSNKRLSTALGELESVFGDMNKQFDDGLKMLTTPLGQMPGEEQIAPTGTQYYSPTSEDKSGGYTGSGKQFNLSQLIKLAQQVGFKGNNAAVAASVAMAESGGNSMAHNRKRPDNSYGLWQINMIDDLGPDRRRRYNLKSNDDLFDPLTNAKVAYKMSGGSNFSAWTTYTGGKYLAFLPSAQNLLSSGAVQKASLPTEQPLKAVKNPKLDIKKLGLSVGERAGYSQSRKRIHPGRDIAIAAGTPVSVISDATITDVGYEGGYGNFVTYVDSNGVEHLYGHLKERANVKRGDKLPSGTVIGYVGSTGRSTGPHLHWEVSKKVGEVGRPRKNVIDPIESGYGATAPFGGSLMPSQKNAQIEPPKQQQLNLPSTARAPQVMVMDDRPAPQPQQPQVASGGGSAPPMMDSGNVLNNLMRNYLLLDLAYT